MLGFAPLASITLGDDGAVSLPVDSLSANNITTGNPVVGSSSVSQDQVLAPVAITTGNPTVDSTTLTQISTGGLVANDITTGNPVVGSTSAAITSNLSAQGITTGNATVSASSLSQNNVLVSVEITTG
jgi:hypothetical protein